MDFKNSYRMEAVYFQKLKSDIDIAKSYIAAGATDEARAVLENLVDVDGAVLLLYRNIGECWAELANAIEKTKKELDALRDQMEDYHDELNEKIDEVNNVIIRLINALEERVEDLERRMTQAENDIDALELRMDTAESDIDSLEDRMDTAESDIDSLEGRMDTAESDIDALELALDGKQDALTPGFGILIDSNDEISVDPSDIQVKLIAGQNVTLTPDATDPTKTVIDAAGSNFTAGKGIQISADDEISITGSFDFFDVSSYYAEGLYELTYPSFNFSDITRKFYRAALNSVATANNKITFSPARYNSYAVSGAQVGDTVKLTETFEIHCNFGGGNNPVVGRFTFHSFAECVTADSYEMYRDIVDGIQITNKYFKIGHPADSCLFTVQRVRLLEVNGFHVSASDMSSFVNLRLGVKANYT